MEHNAVELEAPVWMNERFFEKAMQSAENDETISMAGILVYCILVMFKGDNRLQIKESTGGNPKGGDQNNTHYGRTQNGYVEGCYTI